jgi:hypothetical protein
MQETSCTGLFRSVRKVTCHGMVLSERKADAEQDQAEKVVFVKGIAGIISAANQVSPEKGEEFTAFVESARCV